MNLSLGNLHTSEGDSELQSLLAPIATLHKKNTCVWWQEFILAQTFWSELSYMRNFLKESPKLTASKTSLCKWHLRDKSMQNSRGQVRVIFLNTCQALSLQLSFFLCPIPRKIWLWWKNDGLNHKRWRVESSQHSFKHRPSCCYGNVS